MSPPGLKLCIDCAHHKTVGDSHVCMGVRSFVTGEPIDQDCEEAREKGARCDWEGLLWEESLETKLESLQRLRSVVANGPRAALQAEFLADLDSRIDMIVKTTPPER